MLSRLDTPTQNDTRTSDGLGRWTARRSIPSADDRWAKSLPFESSSSFVSAVNEMTSSLESRKMAGSTTSTGHLQSKSLNLMTSDEIVQVHCMYDQFYNLITAGFPIDVAVNPMLNPNYRLFIQFVFSSNTELWTTEENDRWHLVEERRSYVFFSRIEPERLEYVRWSSSDLSDETHDGREGSVESAAKSNWKASTIHWHVDESEERDVSAPVIVRPTFALP